MYDVGTSSMLFKIADGTANEASTCIKEYDDDDGAWYNGDPVYYCFCTDEAECTAALNAGKTPPPKKKKDRAGGGRT